VELSPQGEARVEEGTLELLLRSDLGVDSNFPIFIPAVIYNRGHRKTTIHLMEGYVFIGSSLPDTLYYRLENRPYISRVMSTNTGPHHMRTLSVIPDSEIEGLKRQLQAEIGMLVSVGDRVRVVEGTYRSLEGIIQGRDEENAFVEFDFRSMLSVATVPLAFLESASDEEDKGIDIRIPGYVRYTGYMCWPSNLDKSLGKLLGSADFIDVWYEDSFLGKKRVAWNKRRIFLGKPLLAELPEDRTVFTISKKPDGSFVVRSR
jgi:transcription antitermination factor NusG